MTFENSLPSSSPLRMKQRTRVGAVVGLAWRGRCAIGVTISAWPSYREISMAEKYIPDLVTKYGIFRVALSRDQHGPQM